MLTRSGAEIVVDGDVVYKLHRRGTDPRALGRRLKIAATVAATLSPLSVHPVPIGQRWRTSWRLVETVGEQPDRLPWRDAGTLLAALHAEPVPADAPAHGWPARLRAAVRNLREAAPSAASRAVWTAATRLPDDMWRAGPPGRRSALVHGDFHLGQLGRYGAAWVLIDVDDLGGGDPLWDLSRPAGFWAAGLIPDEDWEVFLTAYRELGTALPPGDPWPALEPFARAAVVHAAAAGLAHGDEDTTQEALLAACRRMA